MNKKILLLIIIIVVAILCVWGYLVYQKYINIQDKMAGWKTYNSSELGISFKYPEDWGEATEIYYNSVTDKKREIDANGKRLYVYFVDHCVNNCDGGYAGRHPTITALSSDYLPWEGGPYYKGEKSLQEVYETTNNPKLEPKYFNLVSNIPALQFISTNWEQMGGGFPIFQDTIKVFAKPISGNFSGVEISYSISNGSEPKSEVEKESMEQRGTKFLEDFKNRKLEKVTQDKIDDFDLFISSFKFTK